MTDDRALLVAFCGWFYDYSAGRDETTDEFRPIDADVDAFLAIRYARSEPGLYEWHDLAARQPQGCTCTAIDELGSHEATCPEGFPPPAPYEGPREKFVEFASKFADWPTGLLATSTARFCRWCGSAASACACTRAPDPRRDKWLVKEHTALGRVVAYECMARRDGLMSFPLAPPRDTLALAEDDGRASGLPKWEG
jgi:hypothetical protein